MRKKDYIKVSRYLKFFQVAKLVKLMSAEDELIAKFENCTVDACRSHTVIYTANQKSLVRIFDDLDCLDIDFNRVRLSFSNGAYLLIKAW